MCHFRSRWCHEYLTELREHHRGNNVIPKKQVKVGDVVLVEDKKVPRVRWKLGLVTELRISKDGFVRGCKLRIQDKKKNGYIFISRPVNQLCHLEVNSNEQIERTVTSKLSKSPASDSNQEKTSTDLRCLSKPSSISSVSSRPRRNAAIVGELNRQMSNQE